MPEGAIAVSCWRWLLAGGNGYCDGYGYGWVWLLAGLMCKWEDPE